MMGREIRRVPPWWIHPEGKCLFDESYEDALAEWTEEKQRFDAIGPSIELLYDKNKYPLGASERYVDFEGKTFIVFEDNTEDFEEWHGGKPDPEDYRPSWAKEAATHFQLYEDVSEGSPISPVLASLKEIEDWMVANGDPVFGAISRKAAQAFCKTGSAMSMVVRPGVDIRGGIQAMEDEPEV